VLLNGAGEGCNAHSFRITVVTVNDLAYLDPTPNKFREYEGIEAKHQFIVNT
jgi:hypothetical protein